MVATNIARLDRSAPPFHAQFVRPAVIVCVVTVEGED
jgi:hypothetical protein